MIIVFIILILSIGLIGAVLFHKLWTDFNNDNISDREYLSDENDTISKESINYMEDFETGWFEMW